MGNKKNIGLPGGPNEIIIDSRGQWDNPGKNTRIPGNNITMKDVAYPVWAQPNVGPGTMMMPGSEHHFKNADYVDEYPMAQTGGGLMNKIEDSISSYLGDVNKKAQAFALNPDELQNIDNARHAAAGRYAAEGIQNKVKNLPYVGGLLDFIGADKAAGFIGSNTLGLGHELKTLFGNVDQRSFLTKATEMGEDLVNNSVGSIIGSLDLDDVKKDDLIKYLSNNNMLPDGYVRGFTDRETEDIILENQALNNQTNGLSENVYFKDEKGNKIQPQYKRGGGLLTKTMKCNSCSWEWKAADGGSDIDTCHKCGSKALPKAQDAGEIGYKPVKDFMSNYVNSDKFKERLTSSNYNDPEGQVIKRSNNIDNANYIEQEESPGPFETLSKMFNDEPFSNYGSIYDDRLNTVVFDKEQSDDYGIDKNSVIAHEYGHAAVDGVSASRTNSPKKRFLLNDYDTNELSSRLKKYKGQGKHDLKASENKSDLDAFRFELFQQGIYDAGNEDMTKDLLKKGKDSFIKKRLLKNYSEKDLIWLMNNVASLDNSNTSSSSNIGYAQDGGPVDQDSEYARNQVREMYGDSFTQEGKIFIHPSGNAYRFDPQEGNLVSIYSTISNREDWGGSETIDGIDYETVEYGTPGYKQAYEGAAFANQPNQLDEVVISGYNKDRLSPTEKNLYNMFYKNSDVLNPNFKREEYAGKDNPRLIPGKKFTPQIDYNGYEITPKDLFRLNKEAGSPTVSNEPSWLAQLSPTQMRIEDNSNYFRAHANPLLNKMYIPPLEGAKGMDKYIAEIAHLHPDFNFTPTVSGTLDRIKRGIKERQFPDSSNYTSKEDFEHKTHSIAEDNILDYYFENPKRDDWERILDLNRTPEEVEEAKAERQIEKMDKRGNTKYNGYQEGGSIPQYQTKGEVPQQAMLSQYEEPAWYEKLYDYAASPMTTLSYLAQGQGLPDQIPINAENRNAFDTFAFDMINPAAWMKYGEAADESFQKGNYIDAGFNALGALPIVPAVLSNTKKAAQAIPASYLKQAATYADDAIEGIGDMSKSILKDTKPFANNFELIDDVNPLSQAQARNLIDQGLDGSKKLFDSFAEGAKTIDDFVKSYSGDLSSPEGFRRLVKQEAEYLRGLGFTPERIARQAEINAGARLNEIMQIGNRNAKYSKGMGWENKIVNNEYNFDNAYFSNARKVFDDLYFKPGDNSVQAFTTNKTRLGGLVLPGETALGTMFGKSKAVAAHEIGGHGLQAGRKLPIDKRLKALDVDVNSLSAGEKKSYEYFMTGSKGKEPSAFLHELRQAMMDAKLIKGRYDYVSPEKLKMAKLFFSRRPAGTVNKVADKFHSNTRILDFIKNTPKNLQLLSTELNNLPAAIPGVVGLGTVGALSQQQDGGDTPLGPLPPQEIVGPLEETQKITKPASWRDLKIDTEGLKRAIAQVESVNGVLMINPESTATGLYGQRFSEVKRGKLYKGTREEFAKDLEAQNRIFEMRLNEGIKANKTTPLLKDAFDLTNEYKDQLGDKWDYSYEDIIALSNFLGRGGTREFLGNVIRDGKSLEEVYPTKFGEGARQANKTPYQYLDTTRNYYQTAGEIRRVVQDNTRVSRPRMVDIKPNQNSNPLNIYDYKKEYEEQDPYARAQDNTRVDSVTDNFVIPEIGSIPPMSSEESEAVFQTLDHQRKFNEEVDSSYVDPVLQGDFTINANYFSDGWKDMGDASEEEVIALQNTLLQKGYDIGLTGADGDYGDKTYEAHKAMVDDSNLNPNSISRYYKNYKKDTKQEVKNIQQKLIDEGYMSDKLLNIDRSSVDGKFGDQTKDALDAYNTANTKEDPKSKVFDVIPSTLEETRCAAGMCSILEGNDVLTEAIGVKFKDAWDLNESMANAKNSREIFNIYTDKAFDNVDVNTTEKELKDITKKIKKKRQTSASNYEIGDIVGLYWDGSDHHLETLKSKSHNTHSGFVSDIVDGVPIITHNVEGSVRQQPYDQLVTAWIRRPNENITLRSTYDASAAEELPDNIEFVENYKKRFPNGEVTDERASQIQSIAKRATFNSINIPKILNSSVDPEWLKNTTIAITGVESGFGNNTPRTVQEARKLKGGLQGLGYDYYDVKDKDISLGISKVKYSTIDGFARQYFDVNSVEDLSDDNKMLDITSYRLAKNYELFKDYAKQYPSLGFTETDIRNMAVLSHNQGTKKLLKTGRVKMKNGKVDLRSPEEEIAELRSLYQGTMQNASDSTMFRFLPGGGKIYDAALTTGLKDESRSYIEKVNNYSYELFPEYRTPNLDEEFAIASMAEGGEYGVYKNYMSGLYDGSPREKGAMGLYDRLNRKHYNQAKSAGMSVPNYIMSKVM